MTSMPAHVDADALGTFTGQLQTYIEAVNDETSTFKRALDDVHDTWDDEKYNEFAEIFEQLQKVIKSFTENAEEQVPRLKQMEQDIRDYASR